MNSWNVLCLLLKSLSKSEKRHLTLLSSLQGGEKKYRALLDELEKTAARDTLPADWKAEEEQLKLRLLRKGISGPLHPLRNYLAELLFKSLRLQETDRNPADQARACLEEAALLRRRGLYAPAIERYEAALEQAGSYELFDIQVEALAQLCYLKSQQNLKNYRDELAQLGQRLEQAAEHLHAESRYRALHYQVFALGRQQVDPAAPDTRELLNQLETNDCLRADPEQLNFHARIYYHSTRANLAYTRRDKETAKTQHLAVVEHWQRNPQQIEIKLREYIIALANYLNLCISAGDRAGFEQYLGKLKSLQPAHFDDRAELFQNIALAEQLYFLNTAQIEAAETLIPFVEQGLAEFSAKINRARQIALGHNILTTYFAAGRYAEALEYSQSLANLGRSEHRLDIQSMVSIWKLIFHYELRHDQYLEPLVKNAAQNLRHHNRLHDFERLVLGQLHRLVQARLKPPAAARAATQACFENFRAELQAFAARQGPAKVLGLEEVSIWVEGHCSGKSFAEILRERYAG